MSQPQLQAAQVDSKGQGQADNNKKQAPARLKVFKAHAAMFFRDPSDGNFDGDFLAGQKFGSPVDVPINLRAQPSEGECFGSLAFILEFPFAASATTEKEAHGVSYFCKCHLSTHLSIYLPHWMRFH